MAKGIGDLKKLVKKLIKFGYDIDQLYHMATNNKDFENLGDSVIEDVVNDVIDEFPNYGLIQKVVRSKLVCDAQGENNKIMLLDEKNRSIEEYDRIRIKEILDPKFDFMSKMHTAKYEYRPLEPGMLLKNKDGTFTYNTYSPPKWQQDWFYSKGKDLPNKVINIPPLYEKFLRHLVGEGEDSKASYDYIVKWLANGLKRKNYCILTTIGKQGIGKGVLGGIMRQLFGDRNYYEGSDRMFKGTFNSQIADKRLVYCDEISIKEREDEDRLKLVVNDTVEIEKKGIDAKTIQNYASFYISSNHMDSITLTADDRRFSIVDLTDEKLLTIMNPEEIRSLLDKDNIEDFACYLWHFEVCEKEMGKVFVTERTAEVREMGLKEWEAWVVFEFCHKHQGKEVLFSDAQEELKENFGYSNSAGRGKYATLQNKYPSAFKLVSSKVDGKTIWKIRVFKKE
jgi:hypothetical protein